MNGSSELPTLHVEGSDDSHTIVHLLRRHGIDLDEDTGPVRVQPARGVTDLLAFMGTAALASGTARPVGFVIDADGPLTDRWRAACAALAKLGLDLPDRPPRNGFCGRSTYTRGNIGVWIMPDNETDLGRLEDFLSTLVPPGDPLIDHARGATDAAIKNGASFPPQDRLKAELHCWLAWQTEPGRPYGTAIKAKFFRHDSEVAQRFVAWFRRLFGAYL